MNILPEPLPDEAKCRSCGEWESRCICEPDNPIAAWLNLCPVCWLRRERGVTNPLTCSCEAKNER